MRPAIFALLFAVAAASASSQELAGDYPLQSKAVTVDERVRIAEYLSGIFGKLYDAIPTLSPAEEAWLKTEYDDQLAINGNRYTRRSIAATSSVEYSKRLARNQTGRILVSLDLIAMNSSPGEEVAEWSQVVDVMIDLQFAQAVRVLLDKGIISKDVLPVASDYYYENMVLMGQITLRNVIANIQ